MTSQPNIIEQIIVNNIQLCDKFNRFVQISQHNIITVSAKIPCGTDEISTKSFIGPALHLNLSATLNSLAHDQNRSVCFLYVSHFSHHLQQGGSRRWAGCGPTSEVVQDCLHWGASELHNNSYCKHAASCILPQIAFLTPT